MKWQNNIYSQIHVLFSQYINDDMNAAINDMPLLNTFNLDAKIAAYHYIKMEVKYYL